jgi:hypothetical protein
MEIGGKKFIRIEKTKFRKNKEDDVSKNTNKQKKHNKVAYRLMRQDKEDYAI